LGPGEACVFNQRRGAPVEFSGSNGVYGHVGWGFQIGGTSNYIYGSDDGGIVISGLSYTQKDWKQFNDTRANMLNWFKTRQYDYYNCEKVSNSAVGAAQNMIATVKQRPFEAFNLAAGVFI